MKKTNPSFEELSRLFDYADGRLVWKVDAGRWGRVKSGTTAGGIGKSGYVELRTRAHGLMRVHRIIWAMRHGTWPKMLDHINGVRSDNRLENLRDASDTLNAENKHVAQKNSKTGLLGVTVHDATHFRARIQVKGCYADLGLFKTPEAAHAAYIKAKRLLHEGCTI